MITSIPFYQEVKDLSNVVVKHWGRFTQKKRTELLRRAQQSRENPRLYEFLKWKYDGYDILEWCQHIYPVVVFRAPGLQQYDVNSALLYPLTKEKPKPEAFAVKDPTVRVLLEKLGVPIQNRLTYAMISLNTQSSLQLTCELGCYHDALDTCYSLEWEILSNLDKLCGHDKDDFERFDKQLKLREALHVKIKDPIVDGSGRSAMVGVSTLVAYEDDGKLYLWLKRRSKKNVAIHGGLVHVIPSFIFQPATVNLDDEFNISHGIFREYLEELFDIPEPEMGDKAKFNYFYRNRRLRYLRMLLKRKEAALLYTGIAIDLLSLRPEICTLLWIKNPKWFNRYSKDIDDNFKSKDKGDSFKFNVEFLNSYEAQNGLDWLVGAVPLSHNDCELSCYEYLSPSHITPAGAAAFWLGLKLLQEIIPKKDGN